MLDTIEIGFMPKVLRIILEKDLQDKGAVNRRYELAVETLAGELSNSVYVDSLHSIKWFKLFGCPDAHLSRQQRTMIEYEMQKEAAGLHPEEKLLCGQGLQFYNENTPVFVCGDEIFAPEEVLARCCIKQGHQYQLKAPKLIVRCPQKVKEYIQLLPTVTPVLFYGSLLAVLKPILASLSVNADFIFAVIGPKGHLKTSMVKMYALWLKDDVQKIDFTSSIKKQDIEQRIFALAGQNLLYDDLHEIKADYNRKRMEDRLDSVTRLISNNISNTNVFVTGESVKDMAIGSTRDRMLQISVPKMDGAHLVGLKKAKDMLSDSYMAELAAFFADEIIKNYDAVLGDIKSFLKEYQHPEYLGGGTRIPSHIKFIQLTEFLFRKYYCGDDPDLSCKENLYQALEHQAKIQEMELLEQEAKKEEDYVVVFYDMIQKKEITTVADVYSYTADSGTALIHNGKIYIRGEVLQEALFKRYEHVVPQKKVINALHGAGILEEDRDARTKKIKDKRHYVVPIGLLRQYCKKKEGQDA